MKKFFFLLVMIVLLWNCDPIDKRLTLHNSSGKIIFYSLSVADTIMGRSPFVNCYRIVDGDTVWDETRNLLLADSNKRLSIIGSNAWEEYINERCADSTLRIFLFDRNLIETIAWDTIKAKVLFTEKHSYRVKDLKKMNWVVDLK